MSHDEQPISIVRDKSSVLEQQQLGEATSLIQYQSAGHALVIGAQDQALEAAQAFSDHGATVVCIDRSLKKQQKQLTDTGVVVFKVPALDLRGHLGAFTACVPASTESDSPFDLAVSVFRESGCFDIVLDLSASPVFAEYLPPFGYRHVSDEATLGLVIEELSELQGEFEKPRYFNYNETICAHSRSELSGCTRCLDVCSTGAISSRGEGVEVNPFLCQGCGSCATVCPSGAMTYAYPRPSNAIDRTRSALSSAGSAVLILHTEAHEELIAATAFDPGIVPLMVEEISAFGPDYWLSILAGHACRIVLLSDGNADSPDQQAIQSQMLWVHALLEAVGVNEDVLFIISSEELSQQANKPIACLSLSDRENAPLNKIRRHEFSTHNDKRQTLRLALDAISEQFPPADAQTSLPQGAPFGRIQVDTDACTLCMACVSTCPAKALQDGQDVPALRFVESNCLQCGLCEAACPESAISLQALYTWDSVASRRVETLHDEEPFHCLVCHTPFSTKSMIGNMMQKLSGHWMFQDEKAIRRLKLCGDCRVKDMFETDSKGIDVHKSV